MSSSSPFSEFKKILYAVISSLDCRKFSKAQKRFSDVAFFEKHWFLVPSVFFAQYFAFVLKYKMLS